MRLKKHPVFVVLVAAGSVSASFFGGPILLPLRYELAVVSVSKILPEERIEEEKILVPKPIYLETPEPLKAVYMSQCVVGTPDFRKRLVQLIDETELNAVIIDVKDYSGRLGFQTTHPDLRESVSNKCGAVDMREFVRFLNERGIYTIARITVFQDPYYTEAHPELAVTKESATTTLWRDYKGLSFIDVGAKPFWDYIVTLSKETHALGFDELNYDYIRYPSDGPMRDIYYPWSEERIVSNWKTGKAEVLREFFAYLRRELVEKHDVKTSPPVLSADLFGMTTTNTDDLNIGQILEFALPYFDYISPMVYPSHYPKGFIGYNAPATVPYEVVRYSMDRAVERVRAYKWSASTTPAVKEGRISELQLRPWLQDFDLGALYTHELVRAQMQAVYDAGLTSWMLWDPTNVYTREALDKNTN
jgi:hypothetical protein